MFTTFRAGHPGRLRATVAAPFATRAAFGCILAFTLMLPALSWADDTPADANDDLATSSEPSQQPPMQPANDTPSDASDGAAASSEASRLSPTQPAAAQADGSNDEGTSREPAPEGAESGGLADSGPTDGGGPADGSCEAATLEWLSRTLKYLLTYPGALLLLLLFAWLMVWLDAKGRLQDFSRRPEGDATKTQGATVRSRVHIFVFVIAVILVVVIPLATWMGKIDGSVRIAILNESDSSCELNLTMFLVVVLVVLIVYWNLRSCAQTAGTERGQPSRDSDKKTPKKEAIKSTEEAKDKRRSIAWPDLWPRWIRITLLLIIAAASGAIVVELTKRLFGGSIGFNCDDETNLACELFWQIFVVAEFGALIIFGPRLAHAWLASSKDHQSRRSRGADDLRGHLFKHQTGTKDDLVARLKGAPADDTVAGTGVVLLGPWGSGKSELVARLPDELRRDGFVVVNVSLWTLQAEPDLEFAIYRAIANDPYVASIAWSRIPWYRTFSWPLIESLRARIELAYATAELRLPRVDWAEELRAIARRLREQRLTLLLVVDEVDRATPRAVQDALTLRERFLKRAETKSVMVMETMQVRFKAFMPFVPMLPDLESTFASALWNEFSSRSATARPASSVDFPPLRSRNPVEGSDARPDGKALDGPTDLATVFRSMDRRQQQAVTMAITERYLANYVFMRPVKHDAFCSLAWPSSQVRAGATGGPLAGYNTSLPEETQRVVCEELCAKVKEMWGGANGSLTRVSVRKVHDAVVGLREDASAAVADLSVRLASVDGAGPLDKDLVLALLKVMVDVVMTRLESDQGPLEHAVLFKPGDQNEGPEMARVLRELRERAEAAMKSYKQGEGGDSIAEKILEAVVQCVFQALAVRLRSEFEHRLRERREVYAVDRYRGKQSLADFLANRREIMNLATGKEPNHGGADVTEKLIQLSLGGLESGIGDMHIVETIVMAMGQGERGKSLGFKVAEMLLPMAVPMQSDPSSESALVCIRIVDLVAKRSAPSDKPSYLRTMEILYALHVSLTLLISQADWAGYGRRDKQADRALVRSAIATYLTIMSADRMHTDSQIDNEVDALVATALLVLFSFRDPADGAWRSSIYSLQRREPEIPLRPSSIESVDVRDMVVDWWRFRRAFGLVQPESASGAVSSWDAYLMAFVFCHHDPESRTGVPKVADVLLQVGKVLFGSSPGLQICNELFVLSFFAFKADIQGITDHDVRRYLSNAIESGWLDGNETSATFVDAVRTIVEKNTEEIEVDVRSVEFRKLPREVVYYFGVVQEERVHGNHRGKLWEVLRSALLDTCGDDEIMSEIEARFLEPLVVSTRNSGGSDSELRRKLAARWRNLPMAVEVRAVHEQKWSGMREQIEGSRSSSREALRECLEEEALNGV